jgi:hypothetical protein
MWYNNSGERIPRQNKFYEVFVMMNFETLIHIMKNDYDFTFNVNFGLTKITFFLNICKMMNNPREKVVYFMNTLFNHGFTAKRNEEEETIFTNEDGTIMVRISD